MCESEGGRGAQKAAIAKPGDQQRASGQRDVMNSPPAEGQAPATAFYREISTGRVSGTTRISEPDSRKTKHRRKKGLSAHQVIGKGLIEIVRKEIRKGFQPGRREPWKLTCRKLSTYHVANIP